MRRRTGRSLSSALALGVLLLGCNEGRNLAVSDGTTDASTDADDAGEETGDDSGVADSGVADVGPDDTASDDGDSADGCPHPGYCDCACDIPGPFTAGACCHGDEAGSIDYWTTIGPDGCPHCDCGFVPRRTCELGCFDQDTFVDYMPTALCGEEILETCGNGAIDPGEECEPEPPEECTVPGCPAPGRRTSCLPNCQTVDSPECRLPIEICGNGLDDDCDTAADEGCAAECCTDLVDDNGDGTTDCNDPTCADDPACVPCRTGKEMCGDGCDNDGDCRTDVEDEDCAFAPGPCIVGCPFGPETCGNGCDDDGDGWVDCADPDCVHSPACLGCWGGSDAEMFFCHDGRDNDCDGLTDACDTDCAAGPSVEWCANGIDDDGDGQRDCSDADCACDIRCVGIMPEDCDDGIDNDADTLIDIEDWDCPRPCE